MIYPFYFSRSKSKRNSFVLSCLKGFFALMLPGILYAQQSRIDSMDRLIAQAKNDTTAINLNIDKINLLAKSDLNAAIALGEQILKKATSLNFYNGIIGVRNVLVSNYIFTGNYKMALENIHFLEKYIRAGDSIHYTIIPTSYGMMYGVKGVYDTSVMYYTKAIELNERLHNDGDLPANYTNIAIGYQQLANYPMALRYQQKALTLAQKRGNKRVEANTLLNMGITYQNVGDTPTAIIQYESSIRLAKAIQMRIVELYAYSNLANIYLGKKDYNKAYDLAISAAKLGGASGDVGIQAASLAKAATALTFQHRFAEADSLINRSSVLADSSAQPLNISQAYNAKATNLYLQKKYKEAIPYFEKMFSLFPGTSVYDLGFGEAYKQLSECYVHTGDYKKALENFQLGVAVKDSMRTKENIRKATEISMNFDFQKKQEIQKAEQKINDRIAHSRQILLLAGLGLFLLLAVLAFIGYKNKQKANRMLKEQKQQIESTLGELRSTQAQLIQSEKMASLGELTAGIAHEIQNPLNFVNNFSDVTAELCDEMNIALQNSETGEAAQLAADIRQNLEKINHHGKRADAIVKGMLQHSRASSGHKEPTDLNALCEEYLKLSYHGLRAKDKTFNANLKTEFDPAVGKVSLVAQDVGRVILNLINNAFYEVHKKSKEAGEKGGYEPAVAVSTHKENDSIIVIIKDNGNGIPQKIMGKIFQPFFTTKPTGQGTGLGLSLSYDIIKAHGGTISVSSEDGEGSEFMIKLPVA